MSTTQESAIVISFIDFWGVYDATHSRWYKEFTILVQVDGNDEILVHLRFRKTAEKEFFFLVGYPNGVQLEYESFSGNATRVVRFPHNLPHFSSLEDILHHEYLKLSLPTELIESRIALIRHEWNNEPLFTRVRPEVDPVYQWQD